MKRALPILTCIVVCLFACTAQAEIQFQYYRAGSDQNLLVWDTATGKSKLYYYQKGWHAWKHQLPATTVTLGKGETCRFAAFYDGSYQEVLAWCPETGKSKIYYYSKGWIPWSKQTPQNPLALGKGQTCVFTPYYDGSYTELLVWCPQTGKSKIYYYEKGWYPWKKQMDEAPIVLGKGETCGFAPNHALKYTNVVVWNRSTGASKTFYYEKGWYPWKAQAPQKPLTLAKGEVLEACFYADKGYHNLVFWNPATGATKMFWCDKKWSPFTKALTDKPIALAKGQTCSMQAAWDGEYTNLVVWNCSTGASKLYWWEKGWKPWSRQLTQTPLK